MGARVGFAGPALGASLESPLGSAAVRQEMTEAEALYAFDLGSRWIPVLSVGAGAYHLHAIGSPEPPFVGRSTDVWSLVGSAGAGVACGLGNRAALLLDARVLLATPRPVVTLAGTEIGVAGRPSLLITAGVLASLL